MEFNLKAEMVRNHRSVEYGSSKVGMNGVGVHMQAKENDRVGVDWMGRAWGDGGEGKWEAEDVKGLEGYVRFYMVQPGILKTAFVSCFFFSFFWCFYLDVWVLGVFC